MDASLKPMWESMVFRGIAAILFGVAAVFWPALTLVTLVYLFSIYVLVSGIVNIIESVMHLAKGRSWFLNLLLGGAELGVGLYLVRHPNVTFATFILLAGLMFIVRGVFEVVGALTDEPSATYKTLMVIGGVLSVALGIVLLLQPQASGVAFVWVLGLYALVTGPIWIAMALDVKHQLEGTSKKR